MITSEELVRELEIDDKKNFKLGEVVELFENETAKIKFDGEETPSEKQYAYIATYIPKISDRVLLAVTGGTYIILGKVNFNVPPDTDVEIDRYLFDLKKVTILKGLELTGALTVNTGATIVGNVGVNGSITSTGLSSTGAVSGSSISTVGEVSAASANITGATSVGSLTSSGTVKGANIDSTGTAYLRSDLRHSGSNLGFYGSTPTNRKVVNRYQPSPLGSDPNIKTMLSRLNELIVALQNYGLISGS